MAIDRAIYASPAYIEKQGTLKHPNELRSHALVTYGLLLTGNQWKLTGPDGDHWVQPEWTLCANNAEVLRDAAIAGRGVALLPTFIAGDALGEGTLRRFLDEYRGTAAAPLRNLPADAAFGSQGATVHRSQPEGDLNNRLVRQRPRVAV